jgi:REP element-mobilizing transposase RayT
LRRRRSKRPLSTKEALHLVMRSSWAHGPYCLLRRRKEIEHVIRLTAQTYGVRLYRFAIVSNHIHLLIKVSRRELYCRFIRVVTGRIAERVMRSLSFSNFRKTHPTPSQTEPQGIGQQFWQFRPFSRIVHWGRDYNGCAAYIEQNVLEALGFVRYKPRKDRYGPWAPV